jgi:hypothetical protein
MNRSIWTADPGSQGCRRVSRSAQRQGFAANFSMNMGEEREDTHAREIGRGLGVACIVLQPEQS